MALRPPPRALLFDVFGTCVDWRSTVIAELNTKSHASLNAATASLPSSVRLRASNMTVEYWGLFAQQWRNSYKAFTRQLASDPSIPWASVDDHHLSSLKKLVTDWHIEGLWNDEELRLISLIWHHLVPWTDSASGIALMNNSCYTCTLSNGNLSLLGDLRIFSGIPFTHIFSAEMFGTYKPSPATYLGAAEKLNLQPSECAMVAAHLNDLRAAKDNGLRTIYVERPGEEEWDQDTIDRARKDGWVDIWISDDGNNRGFISVAQKLGIDTGDIS